MPLFFKELSREWSVDEVKARILLVTVDIVPELRKANTMAITRTQRSGSLARFANIVLVGGGVLCVLMSCYSVYHYGLTGRRSFINPAGMVLYCVMPAVLAVALFASLRLEALKRISLALLLLSIGLSIHAANLFLALADARITASNRTLWLRPGDVEDILELAKEHGVDFDNRSKRQVISDLNAKGIDAVPSLVPLVLLRQQPDGTRRSVIALDGVETLPHGGVSDRVTVYCNEEGEWVIYESDEHGFHNPKGIWSSDSVDIVALGDSFTQGGCVPSEKNFVAVVRERYPKTLNLGMAGQGPLNTLATLKDYAEGLKPKIVLWFFYEGNDIADLLYERQSPLLMRYLEGNFRQALRGRQADIDRALAAFIETEKSAQAVPPKPKTMAENIGRARHLVGELVKLNALRQRFGLVYGDSSQSSQYTESDVKTTMDLLERALREAKATVDAWGGRLYFVYLPERDTCIDPGRAVGDRGHIMNIVSREGIPLIDLHHAFRIQSDPLVLFPMRRLGHYNQKGHRLVGDEVLKSISSVGN
jgi:hypothetical protein